MKSTNTKVFTGKTGENPKKVYLMVLAGERNTAASIVTLINPFLPVFI